MLLFNKMAKEMNVTCNLLMNGLVCELPEHMMNVMLKVWMTMGEHTFREDVYTCTLKYRRWNNELRPFWSLKRRVANIFLKWNSLSDDSRGTSTQTIINNVESDEEKSISTNSKKDRVNSNWSELVSVNEEKGDERTCRSEPIIGVATTSTAGETMKRSSIPPMKKTVKNIVLVPYTPKLKDWGNWRIKSPYITSNNTSPCMVCSKEQRKEEEEMVYEPHSLYYSPVHPPEFYEDE